MNELQKLFNYTGMSVGDFSKALGVRPSTMIRMLNGEAVIPQGVISDAHQLNADIDYVDAFLDAHPELQKFSYTVFKLLLDGNS